MLIKRSSDIPSSEITPPELYCMRVGAEIVEAAAAAGVGAALGGGLMSWRAVCPGHRLKAACGADSESAREPLSTEKRPTPGKTSPPTTTSTSSAPARAIRRAMPPAEDAPLAGRGHGECEAPRRRSGSRTS